MRLLALIASVVLWCYAPVAHGQAVPRGGLDLVRALYKQYAWEASDQAPLSRQAFIDEPREKLLRFLEPGLVDLIRRDRECVERTREICRLGFSPLWDSNDAGAKGLRVALAPSGTRARVEFTYPGSRRQVVLNLRVVSTPNGPRIADIEYSRGHTLRQRLGGQE